MRDRRRVSRDRPLGDAARALVRMEPVARIGLMAVGFAIAMERVRPLAADGQFTWGERRIIGGVVLITLGGFALAAWAAGRVLRAAAGLVEAVADSTEASVRSAELIESHVIPNLERAVASLERLAAGPASGPETRAAAEIRRAIGEGRWNRAERLIQGFARDHPHAPEQSALAAELSAARRVEQNTLRRRLDDALAGDDAAEAITCRDALTRHLTGDELVDLDRRLVAWLARWVRRRARGGSAEAAAVAALAADRFGDTDEGRAFRDAVPGLRRRAGLCPACARPYRGPGDACPECVEEGSRSALPGAMTPKGLT